MIRYIGDSDSTTRTMLEGILAMEEEHADDLANLLATLDSIAGPGGGTTLYPREKGPC
jgi:bacterioferritin